MNCNTCSWDHVQIAPYRQDIRRAHSPAFACQLKNTGTLMTIWVSTPILTSSDTYLHQSPCIVRGKPHLQVAMLTKLLKIEQLRPIHAPHSKVRHQTCYRKPCITGHRSCLIGHTHLYRLVPSCIGYRCEPTCQETNASDHPPSTPWLASYPCPSPRTSTHSLPSLQS